MEGVEKRLWELIKVNRRKAREGAGVKKGFFSQAKKVDGGSKPSKDVVEEIVNPGLSSLDQKLKVDAEEVKVEINNNKIHLARLHHHTNCHLVVRNGGIV